MTADKLPKAWIVEVETKRLGSGLPAHEYFAVAVDSEQEAQEAVRKTISATDELVVTRAELTVEDPDGHVISLEALVAIIRDQPMETK